MTRVTEVELVESTGFCNWLDMAGEWGELSTETTYCGLFPLYGLLNNHHLFQCMVVEGRL